MIANDAKKSPLCMPAKKGPKTPAWIVGVIDSYGAVHCKKVFYGDNRTMHDSLFPDVFHKRWRLLVSQWDLSISPCSDALSDEDYEAVQRAVRRLVTPPAWVAENEAWDTAGRPRGEAYEKFLHDWKKKVSNSKRTK